MSAVMFEFCAVAIMVSFTSVAVVGSLAFVLGFLSVIFGTDKDN